MAFGGVVFEKFEAFGLQTFPDALADELAFLGHAKGTKAVQRGEALFLEKIVDGGIELFPDFGFWRAGAFVGEEFAEELGGFEPCFVEVGEGIERGDVSGGLDPVMGETCGHIAAGGVVIATQDAAAAGDGAGKAVAGGGIECHG